MNRTSSNSPSTNRFITDASDIPFWYVDIGDEETALVNDALAKKRFSMGPVTAAFEEAFAKQLDVPYAVMTTSGTMALLMGLAVHGIGPGDEVLVPTRTFIATAHAALLLGAKPVLVDSLPHTTTLDMADAQRKVNSRTKAIMPVHLNGRGADMDQLIPFARAHKLAVIEDAAQGLYSRHPRGFMGTIGDAGCYSFSMVKLVATGQGGVIVTRSRDTYERLRQFRNHGVADVVSHTYLAPGGNFKPTDLVASIALGQIAKRDHKVGHVNSIYHRYREGLAGLDFIDILPVDVDNGEVALWTEVMSNRREEMMDFLASQGIQTRKFLPCCHTAPHFSAQGTFPNSERFAREGFNLPCGPGLSIDMVDKTISTIRKFRAC